MDGACVVDTSAWIEWLIGSALGRRMAASFPQDRTQCIVPTIVQLELSKWLVREVGDEAADQLIAYTQTCAVAPLDTATALLAAELHREHGLATADAIVYATARQQEADVLTCDAHFAALPHVRYFRQLSKPGAARTAAKRSRSRG